MLSEHDCEIVHIEGMANKLADYLSRRYKYCPDPPLGSDFIPSTTDPTHSQIIITSHTKLLPPFNLPTLYIYSTNTTTMQQQQLLTCNYSGCEGRTINEVHHPDCPFQGIKYEDTWEHISGGLVNEDQYEDEESWAPYSPTSPPPRTPSPSPAPAAEGTSEEPSPLAPSSSSASAPNWAAEVPPALAPWGQDTYMGAPKANFGASNTSNF